MLGIYTQASPTLIASVLVFACFAIIYVVVILPKQNEKRQYRQRVSGLSQSTTQKHRRRGSKGKSVAINLKGGRSLDETLRDLEAQRLARIKQRKNPPLIVRMRQAGIYWSKLTYVLIVFLTGSVSLIIFLNLNIITPAAIGFSITTGILIPHMTIKFLRARRLKAFDREFPKALDIIVRGLKSGLPFADCLKISASDLRPPVSTEFQTVVDDQALGVPIAQAVERLAERVPLAEVNFLAIVVNIQAKSGGSLAEALGNLSKTLRERRKLAAKIVAMSQEAKSSAAIIGSLPFFVTGAIYLIAPDYLNPLFTRRGGQIVLAISAAWMMIGIAVMRKMIRFDV